MSDSTDEKWEVESRKSRRSPSLFGAIVLIAVGVYFLLYNLGALPGLNWAAALRLWPLLLIFLGINILVQQVPPPWGSLLSALVAVAAVGVFGYVLLYGLDETVVEPFGIAIPATDVQRREISFDAGGVERADVTIDFSTPGARVGALADSNDLIAGEVSYVDDLDFDSELADDGQAVVRLSVSSMGTWPFFDQIEFDESDRWQLGLNPAVPLDLNLDIGSGAVVLDLDALSLTDLAIDGSAGAMVLTLPDGNYDLLYDGASGASEITFAAAGRQAVEIEGGSGAIALLIPANVPARLEVEGGSGPFNVSDRFTQVSGDEPDEGVWETGDYDGAGDRLDLVLDIASGSVTITEP